MSVTRRAFLDDLARALGPEWSKARIARVRPQAVEGMRLRAKGVRGEVEVVPSTVWSNVISWDPFPGRGKPHWDIHTDDGALQRTCVLEKAVELLESWRRSKLPAKRASPSSMLDEMRPVLARIAEERRAHPVTIVRAKDPAKLALTSEGRAQLRAAERAIDPAAVARNFPREDDGRLPLGIDVLLAPIESTARLASGRGVWLCLSSPSSRGGGSKVTLGLRDVRPENATHRWNDAPHLFRKGARAPAIPNRGRALASVRLLDEGAFEKALAMHRVRLEKNVLKVLEGRPLSARDGSLAPRWRAALRRALWEMAPWQLARIAPEKGARLVLLPGQRQQRKQWVVWTKDGLALECTAALDRLPNAAWKRPIDFDLARLA